MTNVVEQVRDRIKELRRVRFGDLVPHPKNWRLHPQIQRDAMSAILRDIGFAGAVLARELPDGKLQTIDGHLRSDMLADSILPVLVTDLNDEEVLKLLLTYDPLSALAEASPAMLEALEKEVQFADQKLADVVRDMALEHGIASDPQLSEGDEGETVEEADGPTETAPGDLWILGGHRLLCGDCRKPEDVARLLNGKRINLLVTSPPYAAQREYDESSGFRPIKPAEYVEWFDAVQLNVRNNLADDGSFFVNIKEHCEDGERELYVYDLVVAMRRRWGWNFIDTLCWKNSGTPKRVSRRFKNQWEPIYHWARSLDFKFRPQDVMHSTNRAFEGGGMSLTEGQGKRDVLGDDEHTEGVAYPGNVIAVNFDKAHGHGAAFPIGVPGFVIRAYSAPGDVVADFFCGSGTTIAAAHQLGRFGYGMEISPRYCDLTVRRWRKLTGQEPTRERKS